MRPLEQIVNEGNSIIKAKDNEIERLKISILKTADFTIEYNKEQFKTIGDLLSKNHNLKLQGISKDKQIKILDEIVAEQNNKISIQNKKIIEDLSYQTRLNEQIENMQNTIDTCREINSELVKENVNLWTCIGVLAVVFVIALIAFI